MGGLARRGAPQRLLGAAQLEYVRFDGRVPDIDQGCRDYLMERCNYNVRTVITNLEKLKIYSEPGVILSRAVCEPLCSTISFHQFEEYVAAAKRGDLREAVRIFYAIYDYGYSVIDILEYFFAFIKCSSLLTEDEKYRTIPLLCKYITVFHNVHENCVELALFTNNFSRGVGALRIL